jgi:hypothetical protein
MSKLSSKRALSLRIEVPVQSLKHRVVDQANFAVGLKIGKHIQASIE